MPKRTAWFYTAAEQKLILDYLEVLTKEADETTAKIRSVKPQSEMDKRWIRGMLDTWGGVAGACRMAAERVKGRQQHKPPTQR